MPKFGDRLIVSKTVICEHFLHEKRHYPRDGFRESDTDKYTLKEGEEVYFIRQDSNFVIGEFWTVQKAEGIEWEFDVKKDCFFNGVHLNYAREYYERQGYSELIIIEGKGLCALMPMLLTVGLCVNLNDWGYYGRYCYNTYNEARNALLQWNGIGNPPGEWIKYKGGNGEYSRLSDEFS